MFRLLSISRPSCPCLSPQWSGMQQWELQGYLRETLAFLWSILCSVFRVVIVREDRTARPSGVFLSFTHSHALLRGVHGEVQSWAVSCLWTHDCLCSTRLSTLTQSSKQFLWGERSCLRTDMSSSLKRALLSGEATTWLPEHPCAWLQSGSGRGTPLCRLSFLLWCSCSSCFRSVESWRLPSPTLWLWSS
jgi:DNA-binding transcriptional LysR family regulator